MTARISYNHAKKRAVIDRAYIELKPTRSIRLTETVSRIRNRVCPVLLRGYFNPICCAVVYRGWRRVRPRCRGLYRSDRHGADWLIEGIGDEHSGYGVLLPAELREMDLPEIFQSRGRKH